MISRSAITLDMDYGTQGIIDELEMFFDMKMVVYSTHKHTPEKPRLRIIIFLTRDVTPDEYGAVSRILASDIGIELFDDSTYEPSRLMYCRALPVTVSICFRRSKGTKLIPMKCCHVIRTGMMYQRGRSATVRHPLCRGISRNRLTRFPRTLIGAFNRTYTVTQAIDKFIPDVYRHSRAIPGRYDYIPADSAAGVVVYDDLFVYSHHATDPCCGKLMNAFDVVRRS